MKNKVKAFLNYIQSIGAKPEPNWTKYSHTIETIYGTLRVSICEYDYNKDGSLKKKSRNNLVSIFSSFRDFEKCEEYLKSVKGERFPTNAKVNYHRSGGDSIEENWDTNFERFKRDLENILLSNHEATSKIP